MAAGLGFKDFTTGEVLTAADVDGYLMQGIWVFASAAARDAAVTSPQEGNFAFLKDTNTTTYYTGSAWTNLDTTGMVNPMTTTGDIIYSSPGPTPVRLGIGSTGNVLTVAGGVPSWAAPASSGGMTLISETSASALSSLSFTSISGSYKQLLLMYSGIRHSDGSTQFSVRLNANSGNIYHTNGLQVNATTIGLGGNSPTSISGQAGGQYIFSFGEGVNNAGASTDCMGCILIDNYASSTKSKSINASFNYYNATQAAYLAFNTNVTFASTSAITSLDITRLSGTGTFTNQNDTTIRLYGVS